MTNQKSTKYPEFGKKLRAAFIKGGCRGKNDAELSRDVLARIDNKVAPRSVRRWLNGDSFPTAHELASLARTFNFSIDNIMGIR